VTNPTRRRVLSCGLALAACGASPVRGSPLPAHGLTPTLKITRYLAARKRDGRFEAVALNATGRVVQTVQLPARGHSFAIDPPRHRAVAFARQAGFFAAAFTLAGDGEPNSVPHIFTPARNRHFYGHGVYLNDGSVLVATENDYDAGRGVLGLYDATPTGNERGNYRRIGEYDSGGIGPHEVIVMPDVGEESGTLCVANGGILTHPDYGKLALNLADMAPSLAYIDAHTGALLEQHSLPPELHRLSIRHLTLDAGDHVWFGCQYMGEASDRPPLVGRHRRGQPLELFFAPDDIQHGLKNYIGSVATDASGCVIATSSPMGGCIAYWDAATGHCLGSTTLFDGCGVAPTLAGGFLLTSGQGSLVATGPDGSFQMLHAPAAGLAWDNHLRAMASL